MATRNFVPRANGEGSIGKAKKRWGAAFFDKLFVKSIEGIENIFASLGVRYSIEPNGYVCFGTLWGKFVLQWGTVITEGATGGKKVVLPLEVSRNLTMVGTIQSSTTPTKIVAVDLGSRTIYTSDTSGVLSGATVRWLHLGIV